MTSSTHSATYAEIDEANESMRVQPTTGEFDGQLLAPFTYRDLSVDHFAVDRRDAVRVPAILDDLMQRCRFEHRNQLHPFCPVCRGDNPERVAEYVARGVPELEAKSCQAKAEMSLRRWLALNPGRDLPAVVDTWRPDAELSLEPKAYLSYDDLAAFPEPKWLIPRLVPDQSVGYLMGRDGTFKTFLAIAMAMHLVRQGRPVLFVAGEGVRSFRKRIDAWLEHHGVDMTEDMKRCLDVRAQTVDLFAAGSDYEEMVHRAEDRRYDLIVIDTLARSSGAAEQNSNSDMNLITQRVDRLKHASGSTVLVVAHTDKGDNGIRGASAIGDNGDFRLLVKRKEDDLVLLSVDKMKDAEDDFSERLVVVEAAESIVLVPADQRPAPASGTDGSHTTRNRILVALTETHDLGFVSGSTIRQMLADDGAGEVNPGTVWRELNKLVGEGIVLKNDSVKAYGLDADNETAQRYLGVR